MITSVGGVYLKTIIKYEIIGLMITERTVINTHIVISYNKYKNTQTCVMVKPLYEIYYERIL